MNQRIKADIIGPIAQSGRFPAMSARPTHPAQWRVGGARRGGFWDLVLLQFILNGSTNRVENVFIKS